MGLLKITRKEGKRRGVAHEDALASFEVLARDQLGVSDAALARIAFLQKEKGDPDLMLRVAIKGGGCSGMTIHYEFCNSVSDRDQIFLNDDVRVVIDKKSLSIVGGATLHCRDYLGSKEFYLVNNPAAKQCSCGQSFSL